MHKWIQLRVITKLKLDIPVPDTKRISWNEIIVKANEIKFPLINYPFTGSHRTGDSILKNIVGESIQIYYCYHRYCSSKTLIKFGE